MGMFIKLRDVVPSQDRPRADIIDPVFPEGDLTGVLGLFEPGHPASLYPAGLAERIPNLAGGDPATLQYSVPSGVIERTAAGGIHCAVDPSAAGEVGMAWAWPASILDYVAVNSSHKFFASVWFRVTRNASAPVALSSIILTAGAPTSTTGSLFIVSAASTVYPTGTSQLLVPANDTNSLGVHYTDAGPVGYAGTVDATRTGRAFNTGLVGPFGAGAREQGGYVVYRVYLEDLTVTGRTYATVSALSHAAWVEATGKGGRYGADEWTPPPTA